MFFQFFVRSADTIHRRRQPVQDVQGESTVTDVWTIHTIWVLSAVNGAELRPEHAAISKDDDFACTERKSDPLCPLQPRSVVADLVWDMFWTRRG